MQSETIKELSEALSKAQGSFPPIPRTADVSYPTKGGLKKYKYAPLEKIIEAIKPVMMANGLSFTQITYDQNDKTFLETQLMHGDDWIRGVIFVCNNNLGWQEKGSALTYSKRYELCGILGISADEDDDGQSSEKATAATNKNPPEKPPVPQQTTVKDKPAPTTLSKENTDLILKLSAKKDMTYDQLIEYANETLETKIAKVPELTHEQGEKLFNALKEYKHEDKKETTA